MGSLPSYDSWEEWMGQGVAGIFLTCVNMGIKLGWVFRMDSGGKTE